MYKKDVSVYLILIAVVALVWMGNAGDNVSLSRHVSEGKKEVQLRQLDSPTEKKFTLSKASRTIVDHMSYHAFRLPHYPHKYFIRQKSF